MPEITAGSRGSWERDDLKEDDKKNERGTPKTHPAAMIFDVLAEGQKRANDISTRTPALGAGTRHLDRIKGRDERAVEVLQVQGRKHDAEY